MHRTEPPLAAAAIALAALAGFVDALAFTSLGGFFASFMSGNSTRLGVSLGSATWGNALTAGALVLSFVSGVILSSVIVRAAPRHDKGAVMAAVTLLLVLAAVAATVSPGPIVLLLLAAAMGTENGVFTRDGEVAFGLTYLTGSLVKLGQKLAGALMGDAERWAWVPHLLLWAGFVAGAILGTGAQAAWGWTALWFAAAASAALTGLMARIARAGVGAAA
ncbi:YoaK family protein [Sphingomonas sp. LB-2]|uniref:YoaK family protein n=1 Tax=Sphingomonas caeni TaxID=2984949 RepID=UPI002230DB8A|nr:YoaK family protein [Sphingomonas caeni]MCW3847213.1 YoaK family protein [Sphingomonas caeni]